MKKLSALLVSVLMVCSVFTACGDSDSSSAKDSASSSVSASKSDKGGKVEYDDENTLAKLRESAVIKELEESGKIKLVGAKYDIDTGKVKYFTDSEDN